MHRARFSIRNCRLVNILITRISQGSIESKRGRTRSEEGGERGGGGGGGGGRGGLAEGRERERESGEIEVGRKGVPSNVQKSRIKIHLALTTTPVECTPCKGCSLNLY